MDYENKSLQEKTVLLKSDTRSTHKYLGCARKNVQKQTEIFRKFPILILTNKYLCVKIYDGKGFCN